MKNALTVMLLLAISTAAAEPLIVSLDPLPYGAIQLAYNQYMIPNVGGMNVLLYSSTPLSFAQPGQAFTPKATLSLSPLPFGAVRMNDSQYMIPAAMPGVMALVISATPLNFAASPLALQTPTPNPATAIAPTSAPSPAPAVLAVEEAKQSTPTPTVPTATQPQPPTVITAVAVKDAPPVTTPEVARATSVATTMPEVPKATPPVATTPEPPQPAPVASITSEVPKAVPVATATPDVPQAAPVAIAQRERGPDAALTTEIRTSTRLPRLPGLPDDLTGNITITQQATKVTFSYTFTSLGSTTYTLNPTALKLTQDGIGVRARLDRRNGNLTPGTLAPGKGEIGTITVNRTTSADVHLAWVITDNAGHTYILNATTAPHEGDLSVH